MWPINGRCAMNAPMIPPPGEQLTAYLRAEDKNRPYLLEDAFDGDAIVPTVVNTEATAIPDRLAGRDAIAEALVDRFGQTYENVRTLCLAMPPSGTDRQCSCDWLVAVSEKENRTVRVGCGHCDWRFGERPPHRVMQLTITIDVVQVLPSPWLDAAKQWMVRLPLAWCLASEAFRDAPQLEELAPVRSRVLQTPTQESAWQRI